ncbi:MAG: hypothetical protein AAB933_03790 [Patescibacteria group bacterium]
MSESAPNPKTGADTIREKVESALKEAGLEEALQVITRLEQEVKTMTMPERFSGTNIASNRPYTVSGEPVTQEGLTEAEFKRRELLADLGALKKKIEEAKQGLVDVTTDIAATGLPGGWLT